MSSKLNLGIRCYAYMRGGAAWRMLTELKGIWCHLQVTLCGPYLSALRRDSVCLWCYTNIRFNLFYNISTALQVVKRWCDWHLTLLLGKDLYAM